MGSEARQMQYTIGTTVLQDWTIVRELGEGSFGTVYEVQKSNYGVTAKSALKVIRVPRSSADIKAALAEGMNEQSVTTYFQGMVDEIVKEIAIMATLKGHPNIVSCEDYVVLPHAGEIGWDILIRMELLTPLQDYQLQHPMDEAAVRRLAMDLSSALVFCQKQALIHRDIKPENVFVGDTGQFKLGDFGVARSAEKTTGGMSKKGTESYMAPEVYLGKPYGRTVDIYSLGLMLYKLLNNGRLPFLPPYPDPISFADRENALARRMRGEPLPPPCNASESFSAVILKASACEPGERYQTAAELLEALQRVSVGCATPASPCTPDEDTEGTSGIWGRPVPPEASAPQDEPEDGTVGVWKRPRRPEPEPAPEPEPEPTPEPEPEPEPEPQPEPEPEEVREPVEDRAPEQPPEPKTPPKQEKTIPVRPFLLAAAVILVLFLAVTGIQRLRDKPMEEAWEAVYANILSDLTADGVDYSARPMSSSDYTDYLASKDFCPQLYRDNVLQDVTWGSLWSFGFTHLELIYWARTPEDPQCRVYVDSNYDEDRGTYLSSLSWTYDAKETVYTDAGVASLDEITPLPCGIAAGDDIDTVCEKLGITQEMLDWVDRYTSWDHKTRYVNADFHDSPGSSEVPYYNLILHDDSEDASTIELLLREEATGVWSLRLTVTYNEEAAVPAT